MTENGTRLEMAVDAILAGEYDRDEWTALCVATVRLVHAIAEYDNAHRVYVAKNPPPPGGWPYGRRTTTRTRR